MSAERSTLAWFHCFAGVAGDMALGSLVDAGADLGEVISLLRRLPIAGWELTSEPVLRGGIGCTRAVVTVDDDHVVREHSDILEILRLAQLPDRVASRARAAFDALAGAEAAIHRMPVAQVHFHEVGGHDAIVDIVGTAAALEVLGVDTIVVSPIATGTGTVRSGHGTLPTPAPAVLELLRNAPMYGIESASEMTTPTGAALMASLSSSFGPMPPMTIRASGYGAGNRDLGDLPNCTQVVIGESSLPDPLHDTRTILDGQVVVQLETNLDDVTGEQLAAAVSSLLAAGAHDAWVTPAVMKKGRPAHVLHALCDPTNATALRHVIVTATGTFGVRAIPAERWPVHRSAGTVEVGGAPVRMKVGPSRAKPEFDDVLRAAESTGLPIGEVGSLAEEAWRHRTKRPPTSGCPAPPPADRSDTTP